MVRFLSIRNQAKVESSFSAIKQLADINSNPPPTTSQLLALCSGTFQPTKKQQKPGNFLLMDSTLNSDINTTDLLGLCSGVFPTATNTDQTLSRHRTVSSDSEVEDSMPRIKRKKILKLKKVTNRFV